MRMILIIFLTLSALFGLSFLLDLDFVGRNFLRVLIVVIITVIVLLVGIMMARDELISWRDEIRKKKQQDDDLRDQ